MKQIKVGTFPLGHENVELYAIPSADGGCFYFQPADNSLPRIKIGLDYDRWDQVVSVLLHETMEFLMARLLNRYEQTGVYGDHASYLFMFTHCQFSDLCQRQAKFVAAALPEVAAHWNKLKAKKKK